MFTQNSSERPLVCNISCLKTQGWNVKPPPDLQQWNTSNRKTLTVIVEPFPFTQRKHILSNNYGYENSTWREAPWLHARSIFCVWKVHISPGARVNSHRVVGKGNYYWCFLLWDESNKEEAAIINSLFHRCFSSMSNQAILLILPAGTFIPVWDVCYGRVRNNQ